MPNDQREELLRLWKSTESLHNRFYGDKAIPFEARWRVYAEETAEFQLAASALQCTPMSWRLSKDDIGTAKECADVIVTAMGLLMGLGITYDDLSNAIEQTIAKNDAKTTATHEIRADGKIARRKQEVQTE